jgi:hypothetical protein
MDASAQLPATAMLQKQHHHQCKQTLLTTMPYMNPLSADKWHGHGILQHLQ